VVVIVVGKPAVLLRMAASERHIGFAPDDGFDSRIFGFAIELDRAEHVAMVGHGHGRLTERLDLLHERLDLIRAVEEAELGMQMEMDEGRSHGRILGGRGRGSQTEEKKSAMTQHGRMDFSGTIQAGGAHEDRGSDDSRDRL